MAWSSAELSATVRAQAALDKPMILGNNRLRGLVASAMQWRFTPFADNSTDSSTPSTRLADGFSHLAVAANAAKTEWRLYLDLGALVTFDAAVILGHNFGSIGGLTAVLAVDDDAAGTNLTTISTWTPASSTKRLVDLVLEHGGGVARQYTARYVRLTLTKGSTFTPQISEVFLSTRRQLAAAPWRPYASRHLRTSGEAQESSSGIETFYTRYKGRRLLNAELHPYDATARDDLYNFWTSDIEDGTQSFVWIEQPTTDPQNAPLMRVAREFQAPWQGPSEQIVQLVAAEQGSQFVRSET